MNIKEEKNAVLNQVETYLVAARQTIRMKKSGLADAPDKEIDEYIGGYARHGLKFFDSREDGDMGLITIPVNGPTCFYRIPNDPAMLMSFKKSIKSAYQEHSGKVSRPADKPKGKDPALIEQEAQAEVDAYHREKESLKREYLYLMGEGLAQARQDVEKWEDIEDKVDRREITLKSLAPEFGGKVPARYAHGHCGYGIKQSWGAISLAGKVSATHDNLEDTERRFREVQKTICDFYPSVLNELTA